MGGVEPYVLAAGTRSSGPGPTEDIVVLAEDSEVSAEIVVSDAFAYWVDRGFSNADSIQAVPLEGGVETTVYSLPEGEEATISSLAMDSLDLYWAESPRVETEMSLIRRMPLRGGEIEPVLAVRGRVTQIVVAQPFLITIDEGVVRATRLSDQSQTTLGKAPAPAESGAIAADDQSTYWLGPAEGSCRAIMVASQGLLPTRLATRDAVIPALRVAGESLYWIEHGAGSDGAGLFVMDRKGGTPFRIVESNRMSVSASYGHALFAADAGGAYWMLEPTGPVSDGALYEGARGVTPHVRLSGVGRPGGVAVNDRWLVFTDMGLGFVVRVPK